MFRFKQFAVDQSQCGMKVGTDGVLLGAWADINSSQSILDIGTGSGLLVLMLAQRSPNSVKLTGVEIDAPAFWQAKDNFNLSPWGDRISLMQGSIQDFVPPSRDVGYDLIVSNPPYFRDLLASGAQRTLARHSSTLPQTDLLAAAHRLLHPNGRFCLILPVREANELQALMSTSCLEWYVTRRTTVFTLQHKPPKRMLLQLELQPRTIQEEELTLFNSMDEKDVTEPYRALVREFYTWLE